MHEQLSGLSVELDQARAVTNFVDLWKFAASEARAVRAVYVFNDLFRALTFAESLLERIDDAARVHNKFFGDASDDKFRLFASWQRALKGAHHRVLLRNSTAAIVFWLAHETTAPPEPRDLAQDFFQVRTPSIEQIKFAAALFDSFLRGHKDWNLWQHVGRAIRTVPDKMLIESCSDLLRRRFRKVDVFHRQLAASFYRPMIGHSEFEPERHRQFVTATLDQPKKIRPPIRLPSWRGSEIFFCAAAKRSRSLPNASQRSSKRRSLAQCSSSKSTWLGHETDARCNPFPADRRSPVSPWRGTRAKPAAPRRSRFACRPEAADRIRFERTSLTLPTSASLFWLL
jgi:hypothetical protein